MANSEYSTTTAFLQDQADEALRRAYITTLNINAGSSVTLRKPEWDVDLTSPDVPDPPKISDLFSNVSVTPDVSWLNDQVDDWAAKYFPAITGDLQGLPEDWIVGVLQGVIDTGYTPAELEAVWVRARDRALQTERREVAQIRSDFSARGFDLPPGAAQWGVMQATERTRQSTQQINAEIMTKEADARIEFTKVAAQLATQYKIAIFQALGEYLRQMVAFRNADMDLAEAKARAYTQLYSALADYYGIDNAFQELVIRSQSGKETAWANYNSSRVSARAADAENPALAQAVRGFADIASAANNAAGTLVAQIEAI